MSRTYSYNATGSATGYGGFTLAYNNRGRLKTATATGIAATYVYDAVGQLVKKSGTGLTTVLFMYDEAGHLLGEYSNAGALVQETVWLGDIPVATLRPKAGGGVDIFYVHTDHLNTPRRVTRPSDNKMRWRWEINPFTDGNPAQNPESLGTFVYNLRLPGQMYMAEIGLRYNYFRDYDPTVGRYVESDPAGLRGGLNTYAYVRNDPVELVDPNGLESVGSNYGYRQFVRHLGTEMRVFLCIYDCNVSCPGTIGSIKIRVQPVFNPPYGCSSTYRRRLGD